MRGFVLCADDFAMTPGVGRSILKLAEQRRLSATSVMANRPHWAGLAKELRPMQLHMDIGLHLNLTLGAPLSKMKDFAPGDLFPAIGDVSKRALLRSLPRDELRAEIDRQLAAFEDALQARPDFIDGHQHVHALPIIRSVLMEAIVSRYPHDKPYLRDPGDRVASIMGRGVAIKKALGVTALSSGLRAQALQKGIATNQGFSGFSAFDPWRDYGSDFRTFLKWPGPRHLIMCHPGEIDDELLALDPVVGTRPHEANFLASSAFEDICVEAKMTPKRFAEI